MIDEIRREFRAAVRFLRIYSNSPEMLYAQALVLAGRHPGLHSKDTSEEISIWSSMFRCELDTR